ncbi:MAG: zinc ribbon domain-containing protein [Eubacterium sp.]
MFCSNCGLELVQNALFCPNCGTPTKEECNEENSNTDKTKKCLQCGCSITEGTSICPSCGTRITNEAAKSSVRDFRQQLMAIEASRPAKRGGLTKSVGGVSKADELKLALIRNYPIPNNMDDIIEFSLLAFQNIDVEQSKQTFAKTTARTITSLIGARSPSVEATISDAWVSKAEECYNQAFLFFSDDPRFEKLEELYKSKMQSLQKSHNAFIISKITNVVTDLKNSEQNQNNSENVKNDSAPTIIDRVSQGVKDVGSIAKNTIRDIKDDKSIMNKKTEKNLSIFNKDIK